MSIKIDCTFCGGSGKRDLPEDIHVSYHAVKKLEPATVAAFSKETGIELTAAHHRVKRLVKLGLVERLVDVSPARYKTVKKVKAGLRKQ